MTLNKSIKIFLTTVFIMGSMAYANTTIFVSHSLNDAALKAYFKEAQKRGATLVMRGLINDSFRETKAKCEKLKISYDINPVLFDDYGVTVVPVILHEEKNVIKKITGHIPLREALRIFQEEVP